MIDLKQWPRDHIEWEDIVDYDSAVRMSSTDGLLDGGNNRSFLDGLTAAECDSRAHGAWMAADKTSYVVYKSVAAHKRGVLFGLPANIVEPVNTIEPRTPSPKEYALCHFRRDHSGKTLAEAPVYNLRKYGAQAVKDILGPTCWPENYGQSPFDTSYLVASTIVNRDEKREFFDDTERVIFEALAEDPGVNPSDVVEFIEALLASQKGPGLTP